MYRAAVLNIQSAISESTGLLGISQLDGALKGHGFSRAADAIKSSWALAPEGISDTQLNQIARTNL
jgi:hypothetical protein